MYEHGRWVIEAQRVLRLAVLGLHTCSPFEEGILYPWIGVLGAHPLGLGYTAGFKKVREVGSPPKYLMGVARSNLDTQPVSKRSRL